MQFYLLPVGRGIIVGIGIYDGRHKATLAIGSGWGHRRWRGKVDELTGDTKG